MELYGGLQENGGLHTLLKEVVEGSCKRLNGSVQSHRTILF